MSLEQVEQQIQGLPVSDVIRLAEWFNGFLASHSAALGLDDWQENQELVAERNRRLAEFTANPAIVAPFERDYFDNLKRQLADERASKASAG